MTKIAAASDWIRVGIMIEEGQREGVDRTTRVVGNCQPAVKPKRKAHREGGLARDLLRDQKIFENTQYSEPASVIDTG
ncbi:hypothetical protein, partial [uncultured Nevskia sp.]|uniref:hypothetical protein n=1 Tax=uncultured Nevskia sp. TaxID=228950 RepID=UPI0025CE3819